MEDLIEINEESEQRAKDESNAKQILVNEDKARATEMRKRAMETMEETKARTGEGCKEEKRRRRLVSQSLQWLQDAIKTKQLQAGEEKKARKEREEKRRRIGKKGGKRSRGEKEKQATS